MSRYGTGPQQDVWEYIQCVVETEKRMTWAQMFLALLEILSDLIQYELREKLK